MILNEIVFDFSQIDNAALILSAVGYLVVFAALLVLYQLFLYLPNILNFNLRIKLKKEGKKECVPCNDLSGETNAAIAMALFMYFNELHDEENTSLTISRVSKRYSPWSSKLYGMNTYFNNTNK